GGAVRSLGIEGQLPHVQRGRRGEAVGEVDLEAVAVVHAEHEGGGRRRRGLPGQAVGDAGRVRARAAVLDAGLADGDVEVLGARAAVGRARRARVAGAGGDGRVLAGVGLRREAAARRGRVPGERLEGRLARVVDPKN